MTVKGSQLNRFRAKLLTKGAILALYKYGHSLTQSQDGAFDAVHSPGIAAPNAGIYKCTGCGHEIGIASGHTLPPQSHPQHPASLGPIRWKLLVYAQHNQ